jgi:hypothetical protein
MFTFSKFRSAVHLSKATSGPPIVIGRDGISYTPRLGSAENL